MQFKHWKCSSGISFDFILLQFKGLPRLFSKLRHLLCWQEHNHHEKQETCTKHLESVSSVQTAGEISPVNFKLWNHAWLSFLTLHCQNKSTRTSLDKQTLKTFVTSLPYRYFCCKSNFHSNYFFYLLQIWLSNTGIYFHFEVVYPAHICSRGCSPQICFQ